MKPIVKEYFTKHGNKFFISFLVSKYAKKEYYREKCDEVLTEYKILKLLGKDD